MELRILRTSYNEYVTENGLAGSRRVEYLVFQQNVDDGWKDIPIVDKDRVSHDHSICFDQVMTPYAGHCGTSVSPRQIITTHNMSDAVQGRSHDVPNAQKPTGLITEK